MEKRIIVAIDGPAGAGKSTVAKSVAQRMGFLHVDSGAMYRAIALWAVENNIDPADDHKLVPLSESADIELSGGRVLLNGRDVTADIRRPEVSQAASRVSAIPGVRRELVRKQQEYAEHASVVMEGRDIGTVVYPRAQVKIYLDASPEVRARRRVEELGGDYAQVLRDIRERDDRDATRADSPLRQAEDAVYLDTSDLDEEGVILAVLRVVREKTSNGRGVTS
ncbi:MAG TPA: (d)CMP kinase [Bryobacteraceae bacterium]|nr:(d)CMP kinase [Bryobacteraceae bacterium]